MTIPRPFWNDGGPLLVAPQEAVNEWEGSDQPSGGRVVAARFRWNDPQDPATDYDRACDFGAESAGMLTLGESWGVVLGTAAAQSAQWLHGDRAGEFYVVGIEVADNTDSDRLRALARAPGDAWALLLPAAVVGPGGLLLAHAASRLAEVEEQPAFMAETESATTGAVIGDGLRYPTPSGVYRIESRDVVTAERDYLTFVRFSLVARAA